MKLPMRPLFCCLAFIVMLPSAGLTAYGIYCDRQTAVAAAREGFGEILRRAAVRCADPLREGANGAASACLAAAFYIDGEEQELPLRVNGAALALRDASGRVTALSYPDRGMTGNAGVFAGGGGRIVFEHKIPGGAAQDTFAALLLDVPAFAVYGEGEDIVRRRMPILAAAVFGGLFVAYVVGGARAVAPLSEAAAAARALAGGLASPADRRPDFLPERYGETGAGNCPATAFDEVTALRAALDKTATRLVAVRTAAAEAGSAGENAAKIWHDVLFSLGRDMRGPVNTVEDMAYVAGKAALAPPLPDLLDEIVSAGRELGMLSGELTTLNEKVSTPLPGVTRESP
ncbi:MAG: hypothetical protein LBP38_08255 [Desulfovibrio sp.]|jgi:hypothetical protein|nr:hypothetical protein [Desulfovibrio sp.]